MSQANTKNKFVIVGVLNWGLGHATRCIPIMEALLQQGYTPVIASDGAALRFLRSKFEDLSWHELPSYNISYSKSLDAISAILLQLPKISIAAIRERRVLQQLVRQYQPVGIISDNRIGFSHPTIPSAYLSHQLRIMLPAGRNLASALHKRFINKFSACWIPDFEGAFSLAGEMTQDLKMAIPTRFLGALSQFAPTAWPTTSKTYQTCTILSGPEPQRSVLESILVAQLEALPGQHIIIRGLPKGGSALSSKHRVIDFVAGAKLQEIILDSELVISRSGYSSLMDYAYLNNKALLIPTHGQPEQEYLARYMLSKGFFNYVSQTRVNLKANIPEALKQPGIQMAEIHKPAFAELFGLFESERES